jgi:hypothetical protein
MKGGAKQANLSSQFLILKLFYILYIIYIIYIILF